MMLYILWLVTSSYASQMATYPTAMMCAEVLMKMDKSLAMPPRTVMAEVMCVPTLILPGGVRPMTPPAALKPGPQA